MGTSRPDKPERDKDRADSPRSRSSSPIFVSETKRSSRSDKGKGVLRRAKRESAAPLDREIIDVDSYPVVTPPSLQDKIKRESPALWEREIIDLDQYPEVDEPSSDPRRLALNAPSFGVIRWGDRDVVESQYGPADAWVVKNAADATRNFRIWTSEAFAEKMRREYPGEYRDELIEPLVVRGGFIAGRPLLELRVTVTPVAWNRRPSMAYRVIHDDTPHDGLKCRLFGFCYTDPFYFMIEVQKHLEPLCRTSSPFLSITTDRDKAKELAVKYDVEGFSGIRILEIDLKVHSWTLAGPKLFHVDTLADQLQLHRKQCWRYEYLVHDHIPPDAVRDIHVWDEVRAHWDPASGRNNLTARDRKQASVYRERQYKIERRKRDASLNTLRNKFRGDDDDEVQVENQLLRDVWADRMARRRKRNTTLRVSIPPNKTEEPS